MQRHAKWHTVWLVNVPSPQTAASERLVSLNAQAAQLDRALHTCPYARIYELSSELADLHLDIAVEKLIAGRQ